MTAHLTHPTKRRDMRMCVSCMYTLCGTCGDRWHGGSPCIRQFNSVSDALRDAERYAQWQIFIMEDIMMLHVLNLAVKGSPMSVWMVCGDTSGWDRLPTRVRQQRRQAAQATQNTPVGGLICSAKTSGANQATRSRSASISWSRIKCGTRLPGEGSWCIYHHLCVTTIPCKTRCVQG